MPALTTIMVLSNVGLQLFNNWRSTNTNQALQKKQQEFQQASLERNHERMMQLLREGQALQEQIEIENHETRIRNIGEDFDALIKSVFEQHALQTWPLTVLPMVMKNQSLGSYRTNNDENIALHVILTPSNCDNFNASVFQQIENGVEIFCNQHWNTLSSHPILFYGEAWKSGVAPTDNEIAQLQTALPHLPILVVTPYFRPDNGKLVFNIHMWGIGNKQDLMIEPTKEEFSLYDKYVSNSTYDNDTIQTTIKEFVPYLQCMIGYLADVYFWSAHNQAPILPSLLTIGAVNIDGMKFLVENSKDNYCCLMKEYINVKADIFNPTKLFEIYKGTRILLHDEFCLEDLVSDSINKEVEIEFVPLESCELQHVYNHVYSIKNQFIDAEFFIFTQWNEHMLIGAITNKSGDMAIYNTLCYRYFVFYNAATYNADTNSHEEYYKININNSTQKLQVMEKSERNPVANMRKKLGQILIKHGESLLKEDLAKMGKESASKQSSVWGGTNDNSQVPTLSLEGLCDFFVDAINEQKISAVSIEEDFSLTTVLDWLNNLDLSDIEANKLYLLKNFVKKYNRYMYSAFLGNNDSILLENLQLSRCFICKYESDEMKDLFGTKLLYVVPFEK